MRVLALVACLVGRTSGATADPAGASAGAGRVPPVASVGMSVRGLAMPTRRDPTVLGRAADGVATALAERIGRAAPAPAPLPALAASLEEALAIARGGALDQAAGALDAAIEAAARTPHRLGDPAGFIDAQVARAAIAFARGEEARGAALLDRVLEYDPGFVLLSTEDSTRLRRALEEARLRAGDPPTLRLASLGEACRDGADVLVVARGLADGATEYRRYDSCRLVASTVAAASRPALTIAAELDPGSAVAARPAARSAPTTPRDEPRSLVQRPWFWIAVGVVTVGAGAAIYLGTRDDGGLTIDPHLD